MIDTGKRKNPVEPGDPVQVGNQNSSTAWNPGLGYAITCAVVLA